MIIIDIVFVLDLALVILELRIIFELIRIISLFASRAVVVAVVLLAGLRGIVSAVPRSSLVAIPISMVNATRL